MWILPEMNLFASNPVLKRYRIRPPGNSPELFNLDSFLNKCLHKAVYFRVRYTHSLHKLDPKNISIETPKKGTSAYLWILMQFTVSLRQENGSYPTRLMYSHQSILSWRPKASLSHM